MTTVEIPPGSGNRYRYEYEEGATVYKGPVGDSPEMSEGEFIYAMTISPAENVVEVQYDIRPYIVNGQVIETDRWMGTEAMAMDELFSLARIIGPDTSSDKRRKAIYYAMSHGQSSDTPDWPTFIERNPEVFVNDLRSRLYLMD